MITQTSNNSQSKTTISQGRKQNSQERFLSNTPKQLPPLNEQKSYRDLKSLAPKSQNQQRLLQHLTEKSQILEKYQSLQTEDMYFSQLKSNTKPPRPQITKQTENNCIMLNLQNSENENQRINIQYHQQNQVKGIINNFQEKYEDKKNTLQYENTIFQPEKTLQQQISERKNNLTIKFTIDSQDICSPTKTINSNYTIATLTKQQSSKTTLKKQLNKAFPTKTENFNLSQFDFQTLENNFENGDQNYLSTNNQFTGRRRNMQTVVVQSPDNHLRNKQSCDANIFIIKGSNNDPQKLNNLQQQPKERRIDQVRHASNPNPNPNLNFQQPTQSIPISQGSQNILSNSNDITQNSLPENKELMLCNQLNQIFLNNTKYLFFKCNNCNYFCIVTQFHNQDYYCQNCDMFSVIADFQKKNLTFSCNHTLNCYDIMIRVQNAIKNEQLALCNQCKQELDYNLIKCFDKQKYYIAVKLKIDVQLLKTSILKNKQFRIAECTGSDCDFFTIWNSKKNQLYQGFCLSCNQRIAFHMEVKSNYPNKINCGHELSEQKLLGLASDAQIRKDFAKCPQCRVFISVKFFWQFEFQGTQYIEYVFRSQLEILKQQFNQKNEIVLSQCSTYQCSFFYVFQNKTIYNSQNQIVFSQQFNLNNQKITSFCPQCLQFSISNEWNSKTKLKKQANIQFQYQ